MERRESDPVSFFFMELYRDRSVIEAIEAIAEHLGEEHDHVRLFAMNSQRQYLLDNYVTNTTAGTRPSRASAISLGIVSVPESACPAACGMRTSSSR